MCAAVTARTRSTRHAAEKSAFPGRFLRNRFGFTGGTDRDSFRRGSFANWLGCAEQTKKLDSPPQFWRLEICDGLSDLVGARPGAVCLLPGATTFAQDFRGAVAGRVNDSSGGGAARRHRDGDEQEHECQHQHRHQRDGYLFAAVPPAWRLHGQRRAARVQEDDPGEHRGAARRSARDRLQAGSRPHGRGRHRRC